MEATWLRPFSTMIMRTRLPEPLLKYAIAATDALFADEDYCAKNAEDAPLLLNITRRLRVSPEIMFGAEPLGQELERVTTAYCRRSLVQADQAQYSGSFDAGEVRAEIDSTWVNEQRKGDFVPAHRHPCDLVCVAYLKMPPELENERGHGGMIEFIDGRPADWLQERLCLRPQAGDVVVFPGWLLHVVYPFRCEGERRVLPCNMILSRGAPPEDSPY